VALVQHLLRVLLLPLSISFHQYSILNFINTLLHSKDKEAKPGNLPKSNVFRKSRTIGGKKLIYLGNKRDFETTTLFLSVRFIFRNS